MYFTVYHKLTFQMLFVFSRICSSLASEVPSQKRENFLVNFIKYFSSFVRDWGNFILHFRELPERLIELVGEARKGMKGNEDDSMIPKTFYRRDKLIKKFA